MLHISRKNGDILDFKENFLFHQVNCMGVMGSGLAKQIRIKHPSVYTEYSNFLRSFNGVNSSPLGACLISDIGHYQYVCNLFSQFEFGNNKNVVYTRYESFERALMSFRVQASSLFLRNSYSIAIPEYIGAGRGNGDPNIIWGIITRVLAPYGNDNDIHIVMYNTPSENNISGRFIQRKEVN